jgi:choline dehydrogenase-like flavoprotein
LRAEKQNALGILNAAIRLHHPNAVDPSHRHSVLSAVYLTKKIILSEERFAVVERDMMRRSRNDARFWFAHVRNVVFDAPRLVSFGLDWIFRRHFSHRRIPAVAVANAAGVYPLDFNGEQAPNPESRVWLGHETDRHGVPKLRVDWRVSELDWLTLSRMLRELKRAVEARCCGTVEYNVERFDQDAWSSVVPPLAGHHIGTARMSENPDTGVVTADCRVHYVDNLYVGGSATFPTSGQANPVLTIVAMALRLAQHLEMRLAD